MNRSITRIVLVALAASCAGSLTPRANAQSAAFTFAPVSGTAAVPGGTFQFTINLTVSGLTGGSATQPGAQNIQGLTYFLQQNGGTTFPFSISGRDIGASPFTDLISTQAQVFASPGNLIDANGNERDLGALADNPMGNGTYFIATITLSIGNNFAFESYTIQTVTTGGRTAVFNDSEGDTAPIQPGSLTFTVIPEPSPLALVGMSLSALAVLSRFRKLLYKR